jgi:predicted aldo/keto reductase-like oxidoreductase
METRSFPGIGRPVSLLGFGLMRLPLKADGAKEIDVETTEKMIDEALAGGVNYFDTAWIYHEGHSESVGGQILSRHPRDSYCLATKLPTWLIDSPDKAERIFEEQLKKLKTNFFDFYLIHNVDVDNYEILKRFDLYKIVKRKKEEGLIRHLGFSIHDKPDHLARLHREYDWDFTQIQLNYLDWTDLKAQELYGILSAKGIPVVVMEPVRGGFLAQLPPKSAEALAKAAPRASQASWALRYAASLPGVLTVLSGMSAPDQLADNLKTFNAFAPLSDAEREALDQAILGVREANAIPCTSCRYCMDCPSGVNIPLNFAIYNTYKSHAVSSPAMAEVIFRNNYRTLGEPERASQCVGCGECQIRCPQNLEITRLMKTIAEFSAAV